MKNILLLGLGLLAAGCFFEKDDSVKHPPTLYGLPVEVQDLALSHPYEDKLFREYGELLANPEGNRKLNPHPEFYLPLGYPVKSITEGVVDQIDILEGEEDQLIFVKPPDAPRWRIAYEHVSRPLVKVGDRVSIGQQIAEVSPFSGELAKTAIMVLHGVEDRKRGGITSYCPFLLFHPTVEERLLAELALHIERWESENGDVFNDHEWVQIGCNRERMTEKEWQNP